MRLAARRTGTGPSLLLLHGFTAAAAAMDDLAARLAARREVTAIDLPGHGGSEAPGAGYGMDSLADDLAAAVLDTYGAGTPVDVCGYSMGGRAALAFAVAHPTLVRSLCLIGASAGIADDGERAGRAKQDDELADRIASGPMEAFLSGWLDQPLLRPASAAGRAAVEAGLPVREANDSAAVAAALRSLGTGRMAPLHGSLGALTMPVLLIAGEQDTKYVAAAREMAEIIGHARVEIVAGVGHATHLDDPSGVASAILDHLGAGS